MLSLIILYLFLSPGGHATPLLLRSLQSDDVGEVGQPTAFDLTSNQSQISRTTLSQTLWGCLFTVVSVAWITIRPNVPSPREGRWKRLRRRLKLLFLALLVPEMMLYWAVRQWVGANKLKERFKEKKWTLKDAHFLQMGGFTLASRRPTRADRFFVVTPPLLSQLYGLSQNTESTFTDSIEIEPIVSLIHIHLASPSYSYPLTAEPILSAIATLQVTWFLTECLATVILRGLTELLLVQIIALAYLATYAMTWSFWWDKPVGVDNPVKIPVILKDREKSETQLSPMKYTEKEAKLQDSDEKTHQRVDSKEKGKAPMVFEQLRAEHDTESLSMAHRNVDDQASISSNPYSGIDEPLSSLTLPLASTSSNPLPAPVTLPSIIITPADAAPSIDLEDEPLSYLKQLPYSDLQDKEPSQQLPVRYRLSIETLPVTPNLPHISVEESHPVPDYQPPLPVHGIARISQDIQSPSSTVNDGITFRDMINLNNHPPPAHWQQRPPLARPQSLLSEDDRNGVIVPGLWGEIMENRLMRSFRLNLFYDSFVKLGGYDRGENYLLSTDDSFWATVRRRQRLDETGEILDYQSDVWESNSREWARVPTFYAYVEEKFYRDGKVKWLMGFLVILYGAIHLLGWNFSLGGLMLPPVQGLVGDAASSSASSQYQSLSTSASRSMLASSSEVSSTSAASTPYHLAQLWIWRGSALLITAVPPVAAFATIALSGQGINDLEYERAVSWGILEAAVWPLMVLYFPAKVALVVLAVLQMVERMRWAIDSAEAGVAGAVFEGVNAAWWTKFIPHFA
ncbi:hypothetical protein FA15DRAFT_664596 [Coprinopsis marcescibilis]|uniref:Uncharacterized protein n=1 Tax=Coprinopsis marcescibilis TaxID=230819 RepID=A0A5C3L7H5_COPMA|nr:hypothetical protein FA15DRAFT_664596 [Coprinopsis marcescibilis]